MTQSVSYGYTGLAFNGLIHKYLEMHGCIHSIVATNALVLKHQAISTHNADYIFISLYLFVQKYYGDMDLYCKILLLPEIKSLLV